MQAKRQRNIDFQRHLIHRRLHRDVMHDDELLRYSRHLLLPQIDVAGQEAWSDATVFVLGCGGLGAAALPYLAASGVGKLIFADDDVLELSNLQRQVVYREHNLGARKALAMQSQLAQINSQVTCMPITERLNAAAMSHWAAQADVVLDCSDNYASRQALNAACVAHARPLVSGAAVRFEGQYAVFDLRLPESACYTCLFDVGEASDGACANFGVFSPLVGVIGALQAAQALKVLLGRTFTTQLHVYDAFNDGWQKFSVPRNPNCPVCGAR